MESFGRLSEVRVNRSSEHREAVWPVQKAEAQVDGESALSVGPGNHKTKKPKGTGFFFLSLHLICSSFSKAAREQRNVLELHSNEVIRLERTRKDAQVQ